MNQKLLIVALLFMSLPSFLTGLNHIARDIDYVYCHVTDRCVN